MKKISEKKRTYVKPEVKTVRIDNQISMVMMTNPPGDPGGQNMQELDTANPYKITNA